MKRKRPKQPDMLREAPPIYSAGAMVRTQIYLTRTEHDYLQRESQRRNEPMASVIRAFIDEKMNVPENAWANNPMLRRVEADAAEPREDGAVNHDHYIYGTPKQQIKRGGKWVPAPALPEDYYENRTAAEAYDQKVAAMDESR